MMSFPFDLQLVSFFLNYFFYTKFFFICLLQFFFIECSNNLITGLYDPWSNDPWDCIFNFFTHKNFFRPIWSIAFDKIVFVFLYCYIITNFKFRIFIFNINRLYFNCSMICIVAFIYFII